MNKCSNCEVSCARTLAQSLMEIVPEPDLPGLGVRAKVDLEGKKSIKFEVFLKSLSWYCSWSILLV